MANEEFYTYIHRKADTGEVFYVGKGKGYRCHDQNNRNKHWANIVKKHGFSVEIAGRFASEKDAFDHERMLIAGFRADGIKLANMTDGGQGMAGRVLTPENREKLSKALKGRSPSAATIQAAAKARAEGRLHTLTPRHTAKAHAARRGASSWNAGKQLSEMHRARISASNKGKHSTEQPGSFSEYARSRALEARLGKPLSQEHRMKISDALKGRNKGQHKSEETRAKMSAAKKAYWAAKREAA